MDMSISMRSVIMLHPDNLLLPAETTANFHTVATVSLTPFTERNVTLDSQETQISPQLDVLLDAHKILAVPSDPPLLATSTEPWLALDVSILTSGLQLDHHAVDLFNGWLPNLSKRFLNSKLTNS